MFLYTKRSRDPDWSHDFFFWENSVFLRTLQTNSKAFFPDTAPQTTKSDRAYS